jgi:Kelch motif
MAGACALGALFPAIAAAADSNPYATGRPPPYTGPPILGSPGTPSPWVRLRNRPHIAPGSMLLMTDGTVLVHDDNTPHWAALVPDAHGSYHRGRWHRVASLPSHYSPLYFASAVLPSGRVIVLGGEYDGGSSQAETKRGAIYDPRTNRWRAVAPPPGWSQLGDAQSTLLADGRLLVADISSTGAALLDPRTLAWTPTGAGKLDANGEQGFSLLPDGRVLTVDTFDQGSEVFDPATGRWSDAGTIPTNLVDANSEQGPLVSGADGSVFVVGATGHTAMYHSVFHGRGNWTQGPDLPVIDGDQYAAPDAAGARLPNGDVLLDASRSDWRTPTHYFLFDGRQLKSLPDAPDARKIAAFDTRMLVLPTGGILYDDGSGIYIFHGHGGPRASWRPRIRSVPHRLVRGHTYKLTGLQLAGRDQGASYGDDFQDNTNYPLVRLERARRRLVTYTRTFGWSSSTAPNARSTTRFTVSRHAPLGRSRVVVVANGIASRPVKVTVTARGPGSRSGGGSSRALRP